MCSPQGFPIKKIFFLSRQTEQGISQLSPVEGTSRLMQTAFIPYYRPELVENILRNLALLAEQVPFYSLNYNLGDDVWKMIQSAE
jgi:hypothetical protein